MRRTGAIMTASLTAPIIAGMRSAVRESALLEGAMAKFDVVFGDQARATEEWVNEFRKGVPLARREIIQSAAAMQDLLVPMGVAREDATEMTKEWLELAAALAAFNDVPVTEALEAIRSGIAGQSRPLRQFGIDVRETALQQRALEMGLISAGEAMSDQVRQQALVAQAYANSKDAVDGYADQLGTTLMQEQELAATAKDLLATYGQDLRPMYDQLTGSVTSFLQKLNDLDDSQRQTIIRAGLWAAALGPGLTALGQIVIWAPRATKAILALNKAVLANPWILAAAAVIELTRRIVSANKEISRMSDLINDALDIDPQGTEEEFNKVQSAIEGINERIEQTRKLHESMGAEGTEAAQKQIQALEEERQKLLDLRNEISKKWVAAVDGAQQEVEANEEIVQSLNEVEKAIQRVRVAMQAPEDDIVDPLGILESTDVMKMSIDELLDLNTRLGGKIKDVGEESKKTSDAAKSGFDAASVAAGALANQLGNVVGQLISGNREGLKFSNILRSVAPALINVLTGGTGGIASSLIGGIFGGFRASGGSVFSGKSYMVGERGPELFTPAQSGMIVPNHQLGGGGRKVVRVTSVNQIDRRTVWQAVRDYEVDL